MSKEKFITRRFNRRSQELIDYSNQIIAHYADLGYRLTLRQLYYQLVSQDQIPNNLKSYKNLASLINDARLAGLVDWSAIEDRNRETVRPNFWESPQQIVNAVARQYRENLWETQPWHIEVMAEKDAVSNILEPICREFGVGFTANRGYPSASLLYEIAKRFEWHIDHQSKDISILYFGDHDPSGLDMDRDITERIKLLTNGAFVDFTRIALTMDQIETWNPPPNPAKQTDARFEAYRQEFGAESWELDAVKAEDLAELVRTHIQPYIDQDKWNSALRHQEENKRILRETTRNMRSADDE